MAKYDPRAGKEVEKTMHEYKHHSKFKNRKQAIAVGLSKARQKGEKVPKKSWVGAPEFKTGALCKPLFV